MDNGLQMALIPATSDQGEVPRYLATREAPAHARSWSAKPAVPPRERERLLHAVAEAHTALEDVAVTAAVAVQRARSLTVILEQALAALEESEPASDFGPALAAKSTGRADALSPREKEVLALVAEGRSNKAIAEALFVSPNTIKTHVASLFHKLGADSRVQLATLAAR